MGIHPKALRVTSPVTAAAFTVTEREATQMHVDRWMDNQTVCTYNGTLVTLKQEVHPASHCKTNAHVSEMRQSQKTNTV